jgi:hypothetical protein
MANFRREIIEGDHAIGALLVGAAKKIRILYHIIYKAKHPMV